ncbi:MAG: hypothetical protein NTU64_15695 [Hyphomicrobiales bacterium]|nr:hypothetical protein [Hyphomicrobiales bacterium]
MTSPFMGDAVAGGFAEPQRAVALDDRQRLAAGRDASLELGDDSVWRDAADLAGIGFREPDIAIVAKADGIGTGIRGRHVEFGKRAGDGNAADLVRLLLGEPEIVVGADTDADRRRARHRQREFLERCSARIEAADLGGAAFTEPQIMVGSFDADIGGAAGAGDTMLAHRDFFHRDCGRLFGNGRHE